jgi:hypothetical protein
VVQKLWAAIIAYEPDLLQLLLFGDRTHAWFPKKRFDDGTVVQKPSLQCNVDDGLWTFGAVGSRHSGQRPKWTDATTWADEEIIAEGKRNVFILQIGTQKEFGTYYNFIDQVTRASIHINGLHWALSDFECSYDIPGADRLELHYSENKVRYAGQPLDDDNFPRYDNPFANVKWGQQSYKIEYGGSVLTHDIQNTFRWGDGIPPSGPAPVKVRPL